MEMLQGHYLGTEIKGMWWWRYIKAPFFARGNGEYWYDEHSFYFRRYLTKKLLVIPFSRVRKVQIGRWHCGKWMLGQPVIKLIWKTDSFLLSSGFVLSRNALESYQYTEELNRRISLSSTKPTALNDNRTLYSTAITSTCHFLR
jgi:hypothetical protein